MTRIFSTLCVSLSLIAAFSFYQKPANHLPAENITFSLLEENNNSLLEENNNISQIPKFTAESSISLDSDGHFRTNTIINGRSLRMLVDTGASMVAISRSDAENLGFHFRDSAFNRSGKSATGRVRFVEINIPEMTVGGITIQNVPTAIIDRRKMPPLLGMTFISRLKKMEISDNMLHFKN